MLNLKQRILFGSYLAAILNLSALILFYYEIISPKAIMDIFVAPAFIINFSGIFDLHRYAKSNKPAEPREKRETPQPY